MKNLLLIFGVSLVFMISGCGDSDSGRTAGEEEQTTETTIKADVEEQEAAPEAESPNELGMTEGLPPDYPSDVPQPPDGNVLGSLHSSEGTVVTFESSTPIKEIVEYYKEKMKAGGYELSEGGEMLVTDQGGLIMWRKNGKEVSLMLGRDTDKGITSVVITYN